MLMHHLFLTKSMHTSRRRQQGLASPSPTNGLCVFMQASWLLKWHSSLRRSAAMLSRPTALGPAHR